MGLEWYLSEINKMLKKANKEDVCRYVYILTKDVFDEIKSKERRASERVKSI